MTAALKEERVIKKEMKRVDDDTKELMDEKGKYWEVTENSSIRTAL